ncbi:MAG: pyridoxal phosphate-dependent aminotransferase [Candidatus Kapaibacteriales bacterium]
MKSFAKRIEEIENSIFSIISRLAFENQAVNLGQGFPDFDGPNWIIDYAYDAMKSGKNQYAPTEGISSLRKNINSVYEKFYGINFNPENEITITTGATEALYSAINAIVNFGDEVILFEPFYDAYLSDVLLAGGRPRFVTLRKPNFTFDPNELTLAITPKTKAIIINSPNNPTGKIFNEEELKLIVDLAKKYDFYIISDEVYEFITYDNFQHIPLLKFDEKKERTIMISSTAKTFSMTGWKIGWAIANPMITEAIRKIHQWTTFAVNTPGQHAMAFAFSKIEEYLPELKNIYQKKRDFVYKELSDSLFKPIKPYGSYFLIVEIPKNLNFDAETLSIQILKKFGVATVPASAFYKKSTEGKNLLRICFAKKDETLVEGVKRFKLIKGEKL